MKKEILEFHAEFCKTFSSPKRPEILCLLKEGQMTVTDITRKLRLPKANVSQHLALMRLKGSSRQDENADKDSYPKCRTVNFLISIY